MLLNDIARSLNPHLEWNAPPRQPRPAPEFRCEMFDVIAAHHEAAHACWNFFHGTPIYDVQINGEGLGGGEFRATPGPKVELSDGSDIKQRATEDLRIMAALVDENTREEWLRHLPGFACPKYAQHLLVLAALFTMRFASMIISLLIAFSMRSPVIQRPGADTGPRSSIGPKCLSWGIGERLRDLPMQLSNTAASIGRRSRPCSHRRGWSRAPCRAGPAIRKIFTAGAMDF